MTGAPFADIAVALKVQANTLAMRAQDVEHIAIAIGLTPVVASHIIGEHRRQAELIGEAHRIIKALMAIETTVRVIIAEVA